MSYKRKEFEWSEAHWNRYGSFIDNMTDEEAGRVFKDSIEYFRSGTVPTYEDRLLDSAFQAISNDIEMSRQKFDIRSENGYKGGKASEESRKNDSKYNLQHF